MFCVITPIFDDTFKATSGLIQDLKEQTCPNFQHILISNGSSPIIQKIVNKADDPRFIYVEAPYESTPTLERLLINIAKRRNYAIENFKSERYFFFDADLLVQAKNFFAVMVDIHDKADIIISKILMPNNAIYPFALQMGFIDIANYSFSKRMAEKYKYPTDYPNFNQRIANDWRFYEQMKDESHYFNDMCYAKKDGRHFYRNISTRYQAEWMRG